MAKPLSECICETPYWQPCPVHPDGPVKMAEPSTELRETIAESDALRGERDALTRQRNNFRDSYDAAEARVAALEGALKTIRERYPASTLLVDAALEAEVARPTGCPDQRPADDAATVCPKGHHERDVFACCLAAIRAPGEPGAEGVSRW